MKLGLAALLAAFFSLVAPARADTLDDLQKRGELVWGADQEGGGPYILPDDKNPEVVVGFEVDFAKKLAEYLKVKDHFSQGQWDKLLDLLRARKVDVVINGYEWNPTRADAFEASVPYYVYGLQLMTRREDTSIQSMEDLRKPNPDGSRRRIGVLTGSAADDWMHENFGETCDISQYDGNTDAMREVETGKLDATLQDTPIAAYYGRDFPKLHNVDKPVAPGYYVIYARKGDTQLVQAIDEAIILMYRNGDLEHIYSHWGIWDDNQKQLGEILDNGKFYGFMHAVVADVEKSEEMPTQEEVEVSVRKHGWEVVHDYAPILAQSAGMTVVLSVVSFPLAILVGLIIAVGRMYGPAWVRAPLALYVEFLRGTPLMIQLYFIFFFLPQVGVNVPAFWSGILGLAINYSAYESEIYRAGLQAIPNGQMEAALSLGMSREQSIFRIIVPQAFRIVIPPMVNDFIALFKDTSVCSVVTIIELTKRFSVLANSTQAIVEMMVMTCVLYLLMSYPMSILSRRLERSLGSGGLV